jgi:hypothetical protein
MVVNSSQPSRAAFYEPQMRRAKHLKTDFQEISVYVSHGYLAAAHSRYFIGADTAKSNFRVAERARPGSIGQILPYLRIAVTGGNRGVLRPRAGIHKGMVFVDYSTGTLPESVEVIRSIEVSYLNRALVETLLGSSGKHVLEQLVSLIRRLAQERDWPIKRVEVRYVRDREVEDWHYVLLLLVFTCDFDTADRYLHELYNEVDLLTSKLNAEQQEVLQRMIFFDVETKASIRGD